MSIIGTRRKVYPKTDLRITRDPKRASCMALAKLIGEFGLEQGSILYVTMLIRFLDMPDEK